MASASQHNSTQGQGCLNLLFIRHGETQDNIDRILQGLRDTELTAKGHKEAEIIAEILTDQQFDALYHSPLTRIRQTIRPVLEGREDVKVYVDRDLTGQCLGELEGKSYDSINMNSPRSADGQPGVERFDDFVQRLKQVFARIIGAEAQLVGQEDRTVVVATHGMGITALFKTLEASPACDGFNPRLATRGPKAWEVRWTDSNDVAKLVIQKPKDLPLENGLLQWTRIEGQPIVIETWGKEEKAIQSG